MITEPTNKKVQMTDQLKRQVGLFGAMLIGLGSMLGTGLFVSLAFGIVKAGPYMVFALFLAGMLAFCNALNSAQLAANYPTSGGAYEYGYRLLRPQFGFTAGWMFLLAKSASAAASAFAFGYVLRSILMDFVPEAFLPSTAILAALTTLIMTAFVALGLKRSNYLNLGILFLIFLSIVSLFLSLAFSEISWTWPNMSEVSFARQGPLFLEGVALLFVAFTGYGRIATLGEEIENPKQNIPKAIILTLSVVFVLYASVSILSVGILGSMQEIGISHDLATGRSFLLDVLMVMRPDYPMGVIAFLLIFTASSLAFLSVLLNLLSGLSRVTLAMSRRGDMPTFLSKLNASQTSPTRAVWAAGLLITVITLTLHFEKSWQFSAFTVLIYYSIMNASAFKLKVSERLFPKWVSLLGMGSCLFIAFWVKAEFWLAGLGMIAVGLVWKLVMNRLQRSQTLQSSSRPKSRDPNHTFGDCAKPM